ncbi:MAG: hypothetical protein PHQ40_00290 [Anaerolineaceae bacterium]|nr:hypothetical protein [Anaerolineaceae bacterium]MDD5367494.1 hypothetical protein [Anaerolineaceae bacterium]
MNENDKEAIARYERELRASGVFDRFSYFHMAQVLLDKYWLLGVVVLAEKLKELAQERKASEK